MYVQGFAQAQYNLAIGALYCNGEGVPQNYARAVGLYEAAAAQGQADAQFNLGRAARSALLSTIAADQGQDDSNYI